MGEVQARRAPDALRGRAEEGAGDAHVVVVGRADVHHQVGGRAQPVPAEGVASPRRQRVGAHDVPGEGAQGHGVALQLEASHREAGQGHGALAVGAHQKIAKRGLQQHLAQGGQRDVVGPSVEELVLQQQRRGRSVLLRLHRVAGLQGCVQDLEAVDVHRSCRLVGQARRLEVRTEVQLRNSVRRHCEVHLGSAPGALVAHEHVHHEIGGRAKPVAAGEEELSARGQVVGAHDVPRVHRQGQGVAVHAHCARGVRGQRLQPLLGRTIQFDSETSVAARICSPMAATTSVVRKAHCYLQRRGCLHDSELAGEEAIYLRSAAVMAPAVSASCAVPVR